MFTGRRYGGTPARSRPPSVMVPSLGSSKPASIRISVVLPQPEGPSRQKNSRSKISSDRLSTATTSPNRFVDVVDADEGFGCRIRPGSKRSVALRQRRADYR